MILATSFTLSGTPTLIANGTGGPHELYLRCTAGTDVVIGGSDADCLYPVKTTDTEGTEVCIETNGEEIWADGTGTLIALEFGLSATPDV